MTAEAIQPDSVNPLAASAGWSDCPETLARQYLPLVTHLVRQFSSRLPAHVSRDELFSAGNLALAQALKSYDPNTGVPFAVHAQGRIRGAFLDSLRKMDLLSQEVRSEVRSVAEARAHLTQHFGRVPSSGEIAGYLGVELTAVLDAEKHEHRSRNNSLEHLQETTSFDAAAQCLSPEEEIVHNEQIRYLNAAIAELPDRAREIIEDYYFEELTYAEIAEKRNIHYTRAHQIVQETLAKMRQAITQATAPHVAGIAARRMADYVARVQDRAQEMALDSVGATGPVGGSNVIDITERIGRR